MILPPLMAGQVCGRMVQTSSGVRPFASAMNSHVATHYLHTLLEFACPANSAHRVACMWPWMRP